MRKDTLHLLIACMLNWACPATGQTLSYVFSTIAGKVGVSGAADGTNETARFDFPGGLAVDRAGSLYVSDILNHTIRKITPDGTNWVVTTLAGLAGTQGSADGTNSGAQFDRPNGVALDQAGALFVADHYNHTIRKLTPMGTNWVVTTIAGLAAVHGNADGTNSDARFWSPTGIAVDNQDNVYVVDTANFTVRKVAPIGTNWVVSTIAGLPLNFGFADGTNGQAQFDFPYGITVDEAGRLFVADWGNSAIRQIFPVGTNWVVNTIAGFSDVMGSADGPGLGASFNLPNSICADQAGALYVTDQSNDTIRQLISTGSEWTVSTLAGRALQRGASDGVGTNALFSLPWGIAVDGAGAIYVADYGNQTIRKGVFVPALQISLSSQSVVLSWPSVTVGYVPESSASLGANATWSALTSAPASNGPNFIVTDERGTAPAFYRLRKR